MCMLVLELECTQRKKTEHGAESDEVKNKETTEAPFIEVIRDSTWHLDYQYRRGKGSSTSRCFLFQAVPIRS